MSASSLSLPQGKSVSLKQFVSRHINEIGLLVVIKARKFIQDIYGCYSRYSADIYMDVIQDKILFII